MSAQLGEPKSLRALRESVRLNSTATKEDLVEALQTFVEDYSEGGIRLAHPERLGMHDLYRLCWAIAQAQCSH